MFTVAGEQVSFRTRKHLALLIRLALEPGKQFTRDYLADLLWPNAAPPLANHSLAQGLSVIKAKIAREAVLLQRSTVGLAAGWIDVDVNHLASNDVAIDGPFLEAFEIASARPFEDWKDEYRARLIPQLRDSLVRQMDAARRIGDFPKVQSHAQRLQDLDPLAEEAIRGIMEARAWASDRSGALKAFARYEARLTEELGAKPGADLVRMVDLLRDGRRSSRPVVVGYPPPRVDRRFEPETLIGREREFSVLYDAWQDARRKRPRIVVVTSDPGVGKTTLVNAFASTCQMAGAVVARAQAYDAERELPFAVLGELVRQLAAQRAVGSADPEALSELARICPDICKTFPGVPRPVDWTPELTPLRIADAIVKTLSAAAVECPVMLVVDDLHAADNASSAILHSVARKLTHTSLLLILTGRPSELRRSFASWALTTGEGTEGMRTLELEVWSKETSQLLVDRVARLTSADSLPSERIVQASGGNPLAIELLTREWIEHGSESLLHDLEALNTHPVATLGIPRAIGAVFERQSMRLDGTTRATLGLAAILGRKLNDLGLYAALHVTPAMAAEALSRLKDEGILREIRGELEFRNELIRAQAYYGVASPARLHLHKRVGELLAARQVGEDGRASAALEIAWHYLRGGSDERSIPFAHEAAESFLAIGAPQEAEEVLKALLEIKQPSLTLHRTQTLLAKALIDQSKAEAAIALIDGLASHQPDSLVEQAEVAMLRASAEFLLNTEPGEKYCEVATIALDCANKTNNSQLISRALFECARAGTEQGVSRLVGIAEQGIAQLGKTIDINKIAMAVATRAICRNYRLQSLECLEDLKDGPTVTSRANASHMSFLSSARGMALLNLGRLAGAYDAYIAAFALAKRVGDDGRMSVMASNICVLQTARGEYNDAIKWGELSIELGVSSNSSALQMSYTNLVDTYILTGRETEALALMERARNWLVPKRRWKFHCGFLVVSAAFELILGNTSLALNIVRDLEEIARDREEAVPIHGSYWKLRIFRAAHLDGPAEAERLAQLATTRLRDCCPTQYLDVLAAKAWLETKRFGVHTTSMLEELNLFDQIGAVGRRALLTAQGFLRPSPQVIANRSNPFEPSSGSEFHEKTRGG